MSDMPQTEPTSAYQPPDEGNGFINFVQQPRILLMLLAGWAIVGFLTELFYNNALFLENHGSGPIDLDGVFAGRAFGWEGIPLSVLYLYCARDPKRFHGIFWLALIEQSAAVAANLYHWLVADYFSFESVVIPIGVACGLGFLSFLNIFQPREHQAKV